MPRRYYSSTAVATTLTGSVTAAATTLVVAALSGYPGTHPYTAVLARGTADEEVVLVTAGAGTNLTVTRGYDGTTAKNHDTGTTFEHGVSGTDYNESQDHIYDSTGVHGIGASSAVVGTTDTQTLTNKTLTAPVIADLSGATHNHSGAATGGTGIPKESITGTAVTLADAQTLSNKILTTPTIVDFTSAQHDHADADDGGLLPTAAPSQKSAAGAAEVAGSAASYSRTDHVHTGGVHVCTSLTRPAGPYDGMAIFETDTEKVLVYNGTTWAEGTVAANTRYYTSQRASDDDTAAGASATCANFTLPAAAPAGVWMVIATYYTQNLGGGADTHGYLIRKDGVAQHNVVQQTLGANGQQTTSVHVPITHVAGVADALAATAQSTSFNIRTKAGCRITAFYIGGS